MRVSIIVATSNSAQFLEKFLASLLAQEMREWQLIIVDNASADRTLHVVQSFTSRLPTESQAIFLSQPDTGIYQAWNRALPLVKAQYVSFIGSDDTFVSPQSLGDITRGVLSNPHLITARNSYYNNRGKFLRHWGSPWSWSRMRQSMNIAHPGMFIRTDLFSSFGPFDETFRICGDYDWLLRLPSNLTSHHIPLPILKIVQSGVSHTNISSVFRETYLAQARHIGAVCALCFWALNWLKYIRRRFIGLA